MKFDINEIRKKKYKFSETLCVDWDMFDKLCIDLSNQISSEKFDLVVGVIRYGAPFAHQVARLIDTPFDYVLLSGKYTKPEWLGEESMFPKNKKLLIIDDTSGTGFTLETLKNFFQNNDVKTCSAFYSKSGYIPNYGFALDEKIFVKWPWHYSPNV